MIISRTGYTGELGFELYVKNEYALDLWNSLFSLEIDIKPIGLAARNTLRLEKGFCLYGNDIDDNTSPLEANLGWITKLNTNFINSEFLILNLNDAKFKGNTKQDHFSRINHADHFCHEDGFCGEVEACTGCDHAIASVC